MGESLAFYLFAGLMVIAASAVVLSRRPLYSVLSLLTAMFCLAALFVLLGAFFIAALQILLYAGAVLVLFLFVIMLLNLGEDELAGMPSPIRRWLPVAVATAFAVQLVWIIRSALIAHTLTQATSAGGVREIGRLLFTTYVIPFELTSFLILAAIIGAVTLARGLWKQP